MNLLFGFSGRIGRGGWWLGQLATLVVIVLFMGILMGIVGTGNHEGRPSPEMVEGAGTSITIVMLCMVVLIAWINLATTIKRFHDRDKSGAWFLISFVPLIGGVWIIVECGILPGSPGSNGYGPSSGSGGYGLADDLDLGGSDYSAPRRTARVEPAPAARAVASPQATPRRPAPTGFGRRGLS